MASKTPKPALRHVALLVRSYIDQKKIPHTELARQLGVPNGSSSVIAGWAHGYNAPSPTYRPKLAALLKVDPSELLPRGKTLPAEVTARALEAHLQAPPPPAQVLGPPRKQEPVLTYSAASDGQAEVRLLARGPHARMAVVFRLLLDAGLVPNGEEDPE